MIEVQLWNESGSTLLDIASEAVDFPFRDARNETGSGSLTVPYIPKYTPYLGRRLVVKIVQDGTQIFAWVMEQHTVQPFGDEPSIAWSGRGLLCWLEAATIYPARGLKRRSNTERYFGFGAGDVFTGALGSTWVSPQLDANTTKPTGWPDTYVYRIWPSTIATAPAGQRAWFYNGFTTSVGQRIRIDATGDDVVKVWMDDDLIIDQDGTDKYDPGVSMMTTKRMILPPGDHWIMVYGQQLSSEDVADLGISGPGNAWVAVRVASIANDTDDGTSITWTHTSWNATHEEPGWTVGFCIRLARIEAANRGAAGYYNFTSEGFTSSVDSNGVAWPHNISRTWPVGTDLLKFVLDLAETGVDVWATPAQVLQAAQSRGTDKSNSVRLFPSKNLGKYGVTQRYRVRTVAAVNSGDGWIEVTDPAAATRGRYETRIDANSINSQAQAAQFGATALAPLASPVQETDGDRTSVVPWEGAKPYKDFGIADIVSVPDGAGGMTTARVMSISYRRGDNGDEWSLELDLAQAGARSASKLPDQRMLTIAASGGAASAGGAIQSATK